MLVHATQGIRDHGQQFLSGKATYLYDCLLLCSRQIYVLICVTDLYLSSAIVLRDDVVDTSHTSLLLLYRGSSCGAASIRVMLSDRHIISFSFYTCHAIWPAYHHSLYEYYCDRDTGWFCSSCLKLDYPSTGFSVRTAGRDRPRLRGRRISWLTRILLF